MRNKHKLWDYLPPRLREAPPGPLCPSVLLFIGPAKVKKLQGGTSQSRYIHRKKLMRRRNINKLELENTLELNKI